MLKKTSIFLALACCFVLGQPFSSAAGYIQAHLTPEAVDIGTFFNGTEVYVSGDVSREAEVVVRLSGMGQDVALKKKGKVLGLLWMNLGSITIHHAKESEGLYAIEPGKVTYGVGESGGKSFEAVVQIPPRLTPGKYLVETFAVKDGTVEASTKAELQVKQVGLPAFISGLAFKRGALYGLLATIIAIAAGLLMGVLFKGEKGAH
ncbi:MAG: TIGR02186 family protein [Deltaproteobacteria bacterium]